MKHIDTKTVCPIIDPSASQVANSTSATSADWTTPGNPIKLYLDTANLGTKSEAFIHSYWSGTASATSAAIGDHLSFGVCLQPLENVCQGEATYVDTSMSILGPWSSTNTIIQPFIGFIDSAGAAIGAGWDADNVITNHIGIGDGWGSQVYDYTYQLNTQVLLKDIVSGGLDLDKFLGVGFSVIRTSTANFGNMKYTIHARYGIQSEATSYQGY